MARRAPNEEKPFRPLDLTVLSSVVQHSPATRDAVSAVVLEGKAVPPLASPRIELTREPSVAGELNHMVQRLDQEKRVLYTREERQALDRLVHNLAVRLQTQLKASHVLRALTALLLHAEVQIDQRAAEVGPLVRPPNGDAAALQRFERSIACILAHALRDAGVPR